jgi:hypothetical protein
VHRQATSQVDDADQAHGGSLAGFSSLVSRLWSLVVGLWW